MSEKIIHLEWVDSTSMQGWVNDYKTPNVNCVSVGLLVSENKESITIASNKSLGFENAYGQYMTIPKCAIKKRKWLKP